ncbi:MAG: CBS domain-containing protein [Polyangiaceae bacterium]|jgi:acetoin utilization protein AcuB
MKKVSAPSVHTIEAYMTPSPRLVTPDVSLAEAKRLMHEAGARHLPVVRQGQLAGILSERDILVLDSIAVVDAKRVAVEAAMQTDVYGVPADTPLDEVAAAMAAHGYGSAVIWNGATVVGIFTTVDAMRALAAFVRDDRGRAEFAGRAPDPEPVVQAEVDSRLK